MPPDERLLLIRRLAGAAGKAPVVPEAPSGTDAAAPSSEEDRVALFGKAIAEAGGALFPGPAESVLHDLGESLRASGVTVLFFPEEDASARQVAEALAPFGPFTLATCAEVRGGPPAETATTAGFRTAEAGIAETGTVVETSAGGRTLLPGLLADVAVSLLPLPFLYGRLDEALAALGPDPPRNVTLRTGPGKAIVLLI